MIIELEMTCGVVAEHELEFSPMENEQFMKMSSVFLS